MKKIFTLTLFFVQIHIVASSIFLSAAPALAGGEPQTFDGPVVRVLDPINPEEGTLYWTAKYCSKAQVQDADAGTIPKEELKNILSCKQFDFKYQSGETPTVGSGCPETVSQNGEYTIVGNQCQLVQIKPFKSGIGLIKEFIEDIYKWGAGLGSIAAVLVIIVSGIQYITAGGDSGKVGPAKERIFQALAALAVLLLSGLILNAINPGFFTP